MTQAEPSETSEKDAPLRYDIRLLGRILGERHFLVGGDVSEHVVEASRVTLELGRLERARAERLQRGHPHRGVLPGGGQQVDQGVHHGGPFEGDETRLVDRRDPAGAWGGV